LSFVSLSWSSITGKLASNWQNFARVRLQLKFVFTIQPKSPLKLEIFPKDSRKDRT